MELDANKIPSGCFPQEVIDLLPQSKEKRFISLHWDIQEDILTISVFPISNLLKEISIGLKTDINLLDW